MSRAKRRRTRGFSITEMLVVVLIVSLASATMAAGVSFAITQYHKSMMLSDAKLLCSTLTSVVEAELASTGEVKLSDTVNADGTKDLEEFFSQNYALESSSLSKFISVDVDEDHNITESSDGYGELLLGTVDDEGTVTGNLLVSSATYSSYGLKAKIEVTYDKDEKVFHATLTILYPTGETLESTFDVLALNSVTIASSS